MKRTKKKYRTKTERKFKVHAILTSDWHLREDTPVCRTDDFVNAQWDKVRQVRKLQEIHQCPVLHAGDLFHHWKTSPALLTRCIQELPEQFCTVYGNHDLPQHSMELVHKSGVNTLAEAGVIVILNSGHWNDVPEDASIGLPHPHRDRKIYVWHKLVWTNKVPFPGAEQEAEGHALLDKYPQFDLLVTGDNHQSFVCKQDGRLLVNPGSLTRQTAGQIDFEPCVYLYNAEQNDVKAHYFDIDPTAVSREHIEVKQERDDRIQAFVERLGEDWEAGLDFRQNLKQFAQENKITNDVMEIAYKALEAG